MKFLVITGHVVTSKNRAGIHHLATALSHDHSVIFLSTGFSFFSILKSSRRSRLLSAAIEYFGYANYSQNFNSIIHFSLLHFIKLPNMIVFLENFLCSIYLFTLPRRKLRRLLSSVDGIIVESGLGLLVAEYIIGQSPNIPIHYRASDDITLMKSPYRLLKAEETLLSHRNLTVSAPDLVTGSRIARVKNCAHIPQGIDCELFEQVHKNPYKEFCKNVIFVGMADVDLSALTMLVDEFPDLYFHLIGPRDLFVSIASKVNVVCYGVLPFESTVPFIQHADVALNLRIGPQTKIFGHTLKMAQYEFCRLPIILPEMLVHDRSYCFGYTYNDKDSIISSMRNALEFNRDVVEFLVPPSWNESACLMIKLMFSVNEVQDDLLTS